MPRIAAGGHKMLAEQTSGANSVLADRLKGEALDDLKTARACIEVLQPLVVTFPSSGLSASKKVLRMQKVTAAFDGSVIAAVNIAAPALRTQESDIERFAVLLKDASRQISTGLGWSKHLPRPWR